MGVTFLHTADLHLGSPLASLARTDADRAKELQRATHGALERIVDLAIGRGVDFVVVSGDLYDERARSVEANDFLVEQFGRLGDHGIACYVIHGNHDPLYEGAERLEWPENVSVFSAESVETIHHPNEEAPTARILGQSYGQQWESNKIYWHYTPEDRRVPNVGLLHSGLNPESRRYAPCTPSDLAEKDVNYWALGHIHTPGTVGGAPAAYPGIPQGRHSGETTVGGCFVVDLEASSEPDLEFVPISPIVWRTMEIDVGADAERDGDADLESDGESHADGDGDRPTTSLSDLVSTLVDRCQAVREMEYEELAAGVVEEPVSDVDWEPVGMVIRVTIRGRGTLHEQLDSEAIDWIHEQVRSRLPEGTPRVWIESIRDRTAPPLPDDDTLRAEDETIDELHTLVSDLREDEDVRQELRAEVGEVWEWATTEEVEDIPDDRLALDNERLDDLIDQALRTATERIALETHNVD